jgi:outer membrane putative beta-barrel porin/alpha-amylase
MAFTVDFRWIEPDRFADRRTVLAIHVPAPVGDQDQIPSPNSQPPRFLSSKDGAMRIGYVRLEQSGSQKRAHLAKVVLTNCTVLVGGIATPPVTAQVQLPTVNLGDTNFEDGFAGPGFLLEEFPDVYSAGTLKDANGSTVPGSNALTTIATTSHIAFVSSKRLFGAWIGGEILVPMADVQIRLASGTNATERGFADPIVGPFALQWAPKKAGRGVFVQRAILDLTVPIGKYSDRRPVNIGNNFVTINPYYAFTYECKRTISGILRIPTRLSALALRTCNQVKRSTPTTRPRIRL